MSTHQQLLYHIVFSTKNRQRWLKEGWRDGVWAYMAGTTRELGGMPVIVGGYEDHVHLLLHIPAKLAVSHFIGRLKASTSRWINQSSGVPEKFGWQDGFGAFSVSPSQKSRVTRYIGSQVRHHQKVSFQDEYLNLLERHEVQYDHRYVWE